MSRVSAALSRMWARAVLLAPYHDLPSNRGQSTLTNTTEMSKPSTPSNGQSSHSTLLLRRQLTELTKRPVEGFSAGAAQIGRQAGTRTNLCFYVQVSSTMTTSMNGRF